MGFRKLLLAFLFVCALGGAVSGSVGLPLDTPQPEYVAWVAKTLRRMQTVKVGMTRAELMRVFTTEGGFRRHSSART